MITNLGYTKKLFILPFDHRSSFEKGMFATKQIIEAKKIIYEAFKKSVTEEVSKDEAAILVDEQYGNEILHDARNNRFVALVTTEKSGQKEFTFEYGDEFRKHIEKYKPTFAKALIRYNPKDQEQSKNKQQKTLKILSDYCHNHGFKFLLEVLIEPKEDQLTEVNNSKQRFDREIRPALTVTMIKELQDSRVEPDVWKLEGMTDIKDYEAVVKQAKSNDRDNVGIVVLGRGANQEQVEEWVLVGAAVEGVIGFAVGRTVFWQPLIDLKNGKVEREKAIKLISDNFLHFCEIFATNSTI